MQLTLCDLQSKTQTEAGWELITWFSRLRASDRTQKLYGHYVTQITFHLRAQKQLMRISPTSVLSYFQICAVVPKIVQQITNSSSSVTFSEWGSLPRCPGSAPSGRRWAPCALLPSSLAAVCQWGPASRQTAPWPAGESRWQWGCKLPWNPPWSSLLPLTKQTRIHRE